jgi:hypothetical protein
MIKIITAPESYEGLSGKFIFLAGTIDNGESQDWQKEICDYAKTIETSRDIYIINPRRKEWNPEATEEDVAFQVRWELEALKKSSVIIMNILGSSKSPISLLELGLFKDNPGLYVFCGQDYYRWTNVRVTCDTFGINYYGFNSIENIKRLLNLVI